MSILIDDAFNYGLISEKVYNMLPKKCHCGAKLELSESLRDISCSNKDCKMQLAYRVKNMCKKLNINITLDTVIDIITLADVTSPYQVLMIDRLKGKNLSNIPDMPRIINEISQALSVKYYICDVIEACGIDDISLVAKGLAHGFNSMEEFFKEVETGQLNFICERLALNTPELSTLGIKIYNEILDIKDELIFAEYIFSIKTYSDRLKISFSGSPIEYLNISEFIDDIEKKTGYTVCHLTTVSIDTDILVKALSSDGVKERMARLINDNFAAEQVNSGNFDIDNIGKEDDNNLAPVGYAIYIDSPLNVIKKVQRLHGVK